MKATPVPEGSWLILQDLEGQVANTLRPFGDPTLPKHTAFPNHQEQIARIRDRGWSVSGRQFGVVKRAVIIALSLRIDGPDGQMKNWITTILSDARLDAILGDQTVPAGGRRPSTTAASSPSWPRGAGRGRLRSPHPLPCVCVSPMPARTARSDGVIEDVDEHGMPSPCRLPPLRRDELDNRRHRAPRRSSTRRSRVSCGRWRDRRRSSSSSAASRPCSRPVRSSARCGRSRTWSRRRRARSPNSRRNCSRLQEEERQRIARELHDSTAQHLVATNLGLMRVGRADPAEPGCRSRRARISGTCLTGRFWSCASSPTCSTRLISPTRVFRRRCGSSSTGSRGGRDCRRASGSPTPWTRLRQTSSVRSCGWCRRRSPTSIAMPGPRA